MKCKICSANIGQLFLEKIMGTHVRDKDGHKHVICFECQKQYTLEEQREKISQ